MSDEIPLERKAGKFTLQYSNMSLRDHFAGLAMQAMLSIQDVYENIEYAKIAAMAYEQADAMIAARKEKES